MMKNCPVSGVNLKYFTLSVLVGFVYVFILDYIVHQNILMGLYEQTETLWRPVEDMDTYFPLILLRNVILVKILLLIFTRNYENKGLGEGIRYGTLMGALLALMMASSYLWMPIPAVLAIGWAGAGLATGFGLGVIFSLTYKDPK